MKKGFFILGFLIKLNFFYSQELKDSLSDVIAFPKAPVTQEVLSKNFIANQNGAQDVPFLLQHTVSAVATSDAGNGVGYTGIRIRGTDASRILVSIDGVPINDSESQSVFWVNMPDVVSSAKNIVLQRGIGSSSNGTSNFGASININNSEFKDSAQGNINTAIGSFSTFKTTIMAESGKGKNSKFLWKGRVSYLHSDGYVDRAFSNLWAYQLQSLYQNNPHSQFQFNYFAGIEKTYQAWYGVDEYTLVHRPTFNFAGAIYNDEGEITGFYDNQTDNYKQDHFTLQWKNKWKGHWNSNITGFYTYGRGYYEEFLQNQYLPNYKIPEDGYADLVRRKWLNNNLLGVSSWVSYQKENWKSQCNISAQTYVGDHYGKVLKSETFSLNPKEKYYQNQSIKNEFSTYVKTLINWGKFEPYLDFQLRQVNYTAHTKENGESPIEYNPDFRKFYTFLNPKIGLNIYVNSNRFYALWGISHREPTRTDLLENPNIKPEKLYDWEWGYNFRNQKINLNSNIYFMKYSNQLILSGRLDDVGNPIRENSGKSYRLGWETELHWKILSNFNLLGNFTLSTNRNQDFIWYDEGGVPIIKNTEIAFSPSVISSFGLEYKLGSFITFQLQNKFVGSQFLDNTQNNSLQLDSYIITDGKIIVDPKFPLLKTMKCQLQLNNIFNQKYSSNGYVYDLSPYYYPQAGCNFLIQIQLEF